MAGEFRFFLVQPYNNPICSNLVAYIFSGDPELERHCAKLWAGQLEGSSSCSAHVCSPWRLCLPVRWVVYTCSPHLHSSFDLPLFHWSTCFNKVAFVDHLTHTSVPAIIIKKIYINVLFICRYPGRPFGESKDGEVLSASLPVLHLLWEHWEASGVLDITSRQLLPPWPRGILILRFGQVFVWIHYVVTPRLG